MTKFTDEPIEIVSYYSQIFNANFVCDSGGYLTG